jgi:hypothetical protein
LIGTKREEMSSREIKSTLVGEKKRKEIRIIIKNNTAKERW